MLRINDLDTITDKENIKETIPKLITKITPVLEKRRKLHEKYSRNASDSNIMYNTGDIKTVISYEKFLTDISAGYLSGKPIYSVATSMDEDEQKILKKTLDKDTPSEEYKKEMEVIIDYISGYNDEESEHHNLVHDILELTACYEILYENHDNEIVYSKYDPLNTVAIWDYSIPANLLAIVRVWDETDINNKITHKCEITDKLGTKIYSISENYKEVKVKEGDNHNWGDVPAIVVETDYAIFETCENVIEAYEQLIQNIRNTFQYNDSECKLIFSNYRPKHSITITEYKRDEKTGEEIATEVKNPAREVEDEYLLEAKTLYVGENGKVDWVTKPLDSSGAVEILKIYTNLMFQLAGIPNTADLAFNSADLNASAIDRKFYIMNMMTSKVLSELKKAYTRRFELIFGRLNVKNGTNYDFRDINIELPKNLPANDDERIDSMLKLQNILSEQTLIEKLGYNYLDEKNKKNNEAEDNMILNIERMKMLEGVNPELIYGNSSENEKANDKAKEESIENDKRRDIRETMDEDR